MENKKGKVAMNDELLDKVSGGVNTDDNWELCSCGMIKSNGVCPNPGCEHGPNYHNPNSIPPYSPPPLHEVT